MGWNGICVRADAQRQESVASGSRRVSELGQMWRVLGSRGGVPTSFIGNGQR